MLTLQVYTRWTEFQEKTNYEVLTWLVSGNGYFGLEGVELVGWGDPVGEEGDSEKDLSIVLATGWQLQPNFWLDN